MNLLPGILVARYGPAVRFRGPLVVLLIALNACGNTRSPLQPSLDDSSAIRVVTWNVKQASASAVDAQVNLLASLRPHVVVLQEAYRGEVDRYRTGLSGRTSQSWDARYAPGVRRSDGNEGAGVVALAAWPIESHEVLMMSHADQWASARPALRIRVRHAASGIAIDVVTTHLSAGEEGSGPRARQLLDMSAWLRQLSGPTLVGGDLNAEPGAPELKSLTNNFLDVWLALGRGAGETFSADRPTRRIDYWLASRAGGLAPVEASVVDVCASSCLSDHKAVVAAFRIGGR